MVVSTVVSQQEGFWFEPTVGWDMQSFHVPPVSLWVPSLLSLKTCRLIELFHTSHFDMK